MKSSEFFPSDHASARSGFLEACETAGASNTVEVTAIPHPLTGPDGEELFTDVAVVGDQSADRALVLISGVHGTETPCGSGCQVAWLRLGGPESLPDAVKVVLVHAINPHGFAHSRRVTEGNVDLNRNFVDHDTPYPSNDGYAEIHDLLIPPQWSPEGRADADRQLEAYAAAHGEWALQQAISMGQYTHPDGLFFGGHEPTWSNLTFRRILTEKAGDARRVGQIDYHTGLGPYGTADLITNAPTESDAYKRIIAWYENGVRSPAAGTSTSVPLDGTTGRAARETLSGADVTAITAEFGTYEIRRVFNALRGDHWLHAKGSDDPDLKRAIKDEIRKALYPDEEDWRELVALRSRQLIRRAIAALARD